MRTHEWVLWVAVAAAFVHALEEHMLDWLRWAREALGFELTWADFYVVNAGVVVLAAAGAMIGWRSPELSLAVPALFAVNAIFFHVLPTIVQRRFSPGVFTAVVVYLPVAAWAYWAADRDGVLDLRAVLVSAAGGVLLMAFPVALIKLRRAPWVRGG